MAALAQRVRGRVIWFSVTGGFGFIQRGGEKIFVHYTAVRSPGPSFLCEGEEVEFTVCEGVEGLQASNVRRIA